MSRILFLLPWALLATLVGAAPADGLLRQGQAFLKEGKLDEAAEALEEAIELAPDDAAAHHLLGATYGRQAGAASMFGKMRLAGKIKDEFERAVALAPDAIDYRESLIQFYAQAPAIAGGGIDKAKAQALEIGKRDAVRGEIAYAVVARAEGKPDEALTRFRAAYAKRPDDTRLGVRIGIFLQELKRYDEAFDHFQALIKRDPEAPSPWYQIGRTSVLSGKRLELGIDALQTYLKGDPDEGDPPHAAAHWRLGMLYELMKRVPDARRQYEAALKLDPQHAEAKAALHKLKV